MNIKNNKIMPATGVIVGLALAIASFAPIAFAQTSGTGTMGVLICTVGAFCFLLGCVDKIFFTHDVDILVQSIIFTGIGAGMLGYRKSQEKHLIEKEAPVDPPQGDQPLNS